MKIPGPLLFSPRYQLGRTWFAGRIHLLHVYWNCSDLVDTRRRAIRRILRDEQLAQNLTRGLRRVKEQGIDLDELMATVKEEEDR